MWVVQKYFWKVIILNHLMIEFSKQQFVAKRFQMMKIKKDTATVLNTSTKMKYVKLYNGFVGILIEHIYNMLFRFHLFP